MSERKMTNRVKEHIAAIGSIDLDAIPVEEVASLLKEKLADIYRDVGEAGFLLLNLEKRGYDTSELRKIPIVKHVRNVAIGVLSKEAFAQYYGRMDILRAMTALPIAKQIELVEEGSVKVWDKTGGADSHRLIDIYELAPEEVGDVFDIVNNKVRTPEEQAAKRRRIAVKRIAVKPTYSYDPEADFFPVLKNFTGKQLAELVKKLGLS